jgi:polyisoprenoid-binding protein YceI
MRQSNPEQAMTRRFITSFALLMCLAGYLRPAAGQSPAGVVDVAKSYAVIFVDKIGLGHQHAVLGKLKEGRIELGAQKDAGRLVFDMRSFVADTPEGRRYLGLAGGIDASTRKQVTETMLGKEILDAKRYPTAVFDIQSASPLAEGSQGSGKYLLRGKFTLHGATRPLEISVEAAPEVDGMHVQGQFSFQQSQYGIKPFTKALGAVGVADRLTVHGEIHLSQ